LRRQPASCETRETASNGVPAAQSLTGERTLPDVWHENYWFRRHEVVYEFLASRISSPATVLDAGCGEGYGCERLHANAERVVVGLDYDSGTVAHVAETYPRVAVLRGNLVALPFAGGAFDAVVSLQVVEHIWEQPRYVSECARVLRPDGLLALSTPNRLTFSPGVGRGEKPVNPFHVNEFDPEELVDLAMEAGFGKVELLGVRHGDRILGWEREHGALAAAQLSKAYDHWPRQVAEMVRSITADDFVVTQQDPHTAVDLLVLAIRGAGA
jgi:SAM-dependent methyltransferase